MHIDLPVIFNFLLCLYRHGSKKQSKPGMEMFRLMLLYVPSTHSTIFCVCKVRLFSIRVDVPLMKAAVKDHRELLSDLSVRNDNPPWCPPCLPPQQSGLLRPECSHLDPPLERACASSSSASSFISKPYPLAHLFWFIRHSGKNSGADGLQIFSLSQQLLPTLVNGKHSLKNSFGAEVRWGMGNNLIFRLLICTP